MAENLSPKAQHPLGNGIQFHIICQCSVGLPAGLGFFLGPNYWFSVYRYWGNKFGGIEIQVILEQRDIINQFGLLGPICGSHVVNINEPERPIKCKDTKVPKKGASKLSIEQRNKGNLLIVLEYYIHSVIV